MVQIEPKMQILKINCVVIKKCMYPKKVEKIFWVEIQLSCTWSNHGTYISYIQGVFSISPCETDYAPPTTHTIHCDRVTIYMLPLAGSGLFPQLEKTRARDILLNFRVNFYMFF